MVAEEFSGINIVQVDMTDKPKLIEICEGIEYIIHLASPNENIAGQDPHLALRETV